MNRRGGGTVCRIVHGAPEPARGSGSMALCVAMFIASELNSAIPVAWTSWLARDVRDEPEAGGRLMVAAIQMAIMLGAALGGSLLDRYSIAATFTGGAILLALAALVVGNGNRVKAPEVR